MSIEVGNKLKGKITGIKKFGAFVELPEGKSGLVHISEVADNYVENVEDHLSVGDEVEVKVLSIADDGKISLSIKKAKTALVSLVTVKLITVNQFKKLKTLRKN
mgnify:CR=1 FL=1